MSSEHAFNHVKALLGKLDRSIDEARARRIGENDDEPSQADTRAGSARQAPERAEGAGAARFGAAGGAAPAAAGQLNGTHQNGATNASAAQERRSASHQPPGASPTSSNPVRRPGIGRARPLTRTEPEADATESSDGWVGGNGSSKE